MSHGWLPKFKISSIKYHSKIRGFFLNCEFQENMDTSNLLVSLFIINY